MSHYLSHSQLQSEWKNVSNEVVIAWFKFQTKIASRSGVFSGRVRKMPPPSPPLSKDK